MFVMLFVNIYGSFHVRSPNASNGTTSDFDKNVYIWSSYVTRIDDPYNLMSFGKIFSEILTLKKCQIGVFWAQPP